MYIHCRFTQTRLCMETQILFYYWERKCKKNCEELRRPYDDVVPMKTCIHVEIVSPVQMFDIIFKKMQRMQSGVGLSNKSKVNLEASIDGISKIHWRQSSCYYFKEYPSCFNQNSPGLLFLCGARCAKTRNFCMRWCVDFRACTAVRSCLGIRPLRDL